MGGINNKHIKITQELRQFLDGLIISDAYIRPSRTKTTARISIGQTIRYKTWIQNIANTLQQNNIEYHIKERMTTVHLPQDPSDIKKQFKRIDLSTKNYVELIKEYNRWYKNKKKIIPKDIELTPITIANWYMGDGSKDLQKIGKLKQKYYRITLCTECFTYEEHKKLKKQLDTRYNWNTTIQRFRNTWRLRIARKKDVIDFLKITHPYSVKCFYYKWKPLFDKDFIEEKRQKKICIICKKEYIANKFSHWEQKVCNNIECKRIHNKLKMRKFRLKWKNKKEKI